MVLLGSSARNEPPEQLEGFRKWVIDACTGGFVDDTLQFTMEIMFGKTTRADFFETGNAGPLAWSHHFASCLAPTCHEWSNRTRRCSAIATAY